MRYAAKHGDSVRIAVHDGVARVTDPTLEHRLPRAFPNRDAILHASVKHGLDPTLLAAVGEQESGMGKGAFYNPVIHIGADGHGHGICQMDDRYYSMAECERAGRDLYFAADQAAEKLSKDIADLGLERGVQFYNGSNADLPYYHHVMDRYRSLENEVSKELTRDGAKR